MTQPIILPLDSPEITLANAGGKALNLGRLVRAGFPVPPGFIVSTNAYRYFVAANALLPLISATLVVANLADPTDLETASTTIRQAFTAGTIPSPVREAILAARGDTFPSSDHPSVTSPHSLLSALAVRSSATAEDLPDMSFAGQQDTFLNVMGDQALLEAVVACWSSLWTARAIAYRERNAIPQDDVVLAVIVQAMVDSVASGVLFTANPLTGTRFLSVIDATLGLGEALVGGQVEPDHYVVDEAGQRILAKSLGAKHIAIRGQAGGGTLVEQIDAAHQQALSDAAILELARLGRRVQDELYGGQPQDIEWAWVQAQPTGPASRPGPPGSFQGQLILLQSRPITSLFPRPDQMPAEPLQIMFSIGHVQGMLAPMTPAGRDAFTLILLALIGAIHRRHSLDSQRELVTAGERLFGNFTPAFRHARLRRLSLAVLRFVEAGGGQAIQSLLNDPRLAATGGRISPGASLRTLRRLAPMLRNVARAFRDPEGRRRAMVEIVDSQLATTAQRMGAARTLGELLTTWEDFHDLFPSVIAPTVLPNLVAGMASFFQLRRLAQKHLGSDQLALQAARGLPHNVTTEMDLALWQVAQAIRSDPDGAHSFATSDGATLAEDWRAGRLPAASQAALASFLARYGMRGLAEIDLGRPRWQEDPTHIIQVMQSYLQIDDPELAPDVVFAKGAQTAEIAIEQIVAGIDSPLDRRLARLFGSRMRALAGLREYPKFMMIRFLGILREGLLRHGEQLANQGQLAQADDIFFLGFRELQSLATGQVRDWQPLIAERRSLYDREMQRKQVPRLLLSDGTAIYEGMGAAEQELEGALTGSPVSPGIVEGPVRVVFDPRKAQLQPGEILVCPGTDPSWTPLFLAAGGLVMEVGGLMTHGSVVAREYGIPAVVGVHQATQRLQTGQQVRVDGSAGTIAILEKQG